MRLRRLIRACARALNYCDISAGRGSKRRKVGNAGDIKRGIVHQRVKPPAFAEALESWLDPHHTDLPRPHLCRWTPTSRRWGKLSARMGDGADLLIAATALEHDLTVVTRNVRHFEPTSVGVVDPFGS